MTAAHVACCSDDKCPCPCHVRVRRYCGQCRRTTGWVVVQGELVCSVCDFWSSSPIYPEVIR